MGDPFNEDGYDIQKCRGRPLSPDGCLRSQGEHPAPHPATGADAQGRGSGIRHQRGLPGALQSHDAGHAQLTTLN